VLTLIEPVAVAVHLQDMDVMGEPVEQRTVYLPPVSRRTYPPHQFEFR
jgi:hypothetical protein